MACPHGFPRMAIAGCPDVLHAGSGLSGTCPARQAETISPFTISSQKSLGSAPTAPGWSDPSQGPPRVKGMKLSPALPGGVGVPLHGGTQAGAGTFGTCNLPATPKRWCDSETGREPGLESQPHPRLASCSVVTQHRTESERCKVLPCPAPQRKPP